MMQGGRTEDQVETVRIRKVHQIADVIANVLRRSALTSDVNQRFADVDANDLIKSFSKGNRMAAGSASSIEGPASVFRQLRQEPLQQSYWGEARGPIVFRRKSIE